MWRRRDYVRPVTDRGWRSRPATLWCQTPQLVSKRVAPTDLLESPAIKAWRELRPDLARPERIEVLKGRKDGEEERIPADRSRPGKLYDHCNTLPAKALIERAIYEEIVAICSHFALLRVRGGRRRVLLAVPRRRRRGKVSAFNAEHRRLAARWLGTLHTSAARSALAARLPRSGTAPPSGAARSARDRTGNLVNPALNANDHAVLEPFSLNAILESRWNQVESLCEGMPFTVARRLH